MRFAAKKNKSGRFLFLLIFLVTLQRVVAGGVSLMWDPSPDASVVGYNIYIGTTSGSYSNRFAVENQSMTTLSNLDCGGTYFFVATAVDGNGVESDFSNEVIFIVPGKLTLMPCVQPGDPMAMKFPVVPGNWYEVQATTDLVGWTTVWQMAIATSNAWTQISLPSISDEPQRFYRLVTHDH